MKVYKKPLAIALFAMSMFATPSVQGKTLGGLQRNILRDGRKNLFKLFGVSSFNEYKKAVVAYVNTFIAQGNDINLPLTLDGMTIIFVAISSGDIGLVKKLINLGANVNKKARNCTMSSPLAALVTYSAMLGFDATKLAELLMKNGANPMIKNSEGKSVIEIANIFCLDKVKRVFKKYGY